MSRKNDKFINAKCPWSLLFHSGGLRRILSLLPCTASSFAPQSCQHETRQHSSESRGLTRTLTLWRLDLEDTSAPRLLPHTSCVWHHTPFHLCLTGTHRAHCVSWLTGSADRWTSQASFQTRDRKPAVHWWLFAGRKDMLYLPSSKGVTYFLTDMIWTTLKFIWTDLKPLKSWPKNPVIFYTNVHKRSSGNHITNFRSHKIVTGAVLHFHLAPSRTFA